MVFCNKCGTENIDDAKFCSKCGSEIKTITNEYSKENKTIETYKKPFEEQKKNSLKNLVKSIKWIVVIPLAFISALFAGLIETGILQIVLPLAIFGFSGYIAGDKDKGTITGFVTGAIGLSFGFLMHDLPSNAFIAGMIIGGALGGVFGALGGYIKENK